MSTPESALESYNVHATPPAPAPDPAIRRAMRCIVIYCVLAFLTPLLFWEIHYAVMRLNYFHPILPWPMAERLGIIIALAPPILCVLATFRAYLRYDRALPFYIGGFGLAGPFFAILILVVLRFIGDPSFATRSHMDAIYTAQSLARNFGGGAGFPPPSSRIFENFVCTGQDLPPGAVPAGAPSLIIAYGKITLRDTGVVRYYEPCRRYIYFGHSRAVAFADGHAELVLVPDLPRVFAAHNVARAALGLPPQVIDTTD